LHNKIASVQDDGETNAQRAEKEAGGWSKYRCSTDVGTCTLVDVKSTLYSFKFNRREQ